MLRKRLPALVGRIGMKKIGKTLRLGQIDLAIPKGPSRKFARFGKAQPGGGQRLQHPGHHRAPAVNMELGHILAREVRRSWEPKHKRFIENLGGLGMTQPPEAGHARRRQPPMAQGVERASRGSARNPDDGDAGAARRTGEGIYGHDGGFLSRKPGR
jgi:hypothetical protein